MPQNSIQLATPEQIAEFVAEAERMGLTAQELAEIVTTGVIEALDELLAQRDQESEAQEP